MYNNLKSISTEHFKCSYSQNLKIISVNISSYIKHENELHLLIDELGGVDVIVISEIRSNFTSVCPFFDELYYVYVQMPINNKCGGIAIMALKSLNSQHLNMENQSQCGLEYLSVKIQLYNISICVVGIYKHPYFCNSLFKNEINMIVNELSNFSNVILCGDFNIDLMKIGENSQIDNFVLELAARGFIQKINYPTRITSKSATLIDHIYVKKMQKLDISAGVLNATLSDHAVTYISIPLKINTKNRPMIRIINDKTLNLLNTKLNEKLDEANFTINESDEVNVKWELFHDILIRQFNNVCKLKQMSRKSLISKKWLTAGLLKCTRKKERLYYRFTRNPTSENEYEYKQYKNSLNHLIRTAKKNYFIKMINEDQQHKKLWKLVNLNLKGPESQKQTIQKIVHHDQIKTSPKIIADCMNEFFSTIGSTLLNVFDTNTNFESYLMQNNINQFGFEEISFSNLSKIVHSMKSKTSAGLDGISMRVIKKIFPAIAKTLLALINSSIKFSVFPKFMKKAKVIPVYKTGDKTMLSNYRPISLLCSLSKLVEKALFNQISEFFNKKNLFYENQHGFRKSHSTIDTLLSLNHYLADEIFNKKKKVCGVFVDYSKAFDCIDHQILLRKLSHYGFNDSAVQLIENYLCSRTIQTEINGIISSEKFISCGVPQGSILGPLLFLIYVNDIKLLNLNAYLFADDTNIFFSAESNQDLERVVSDGMLKFARWSDANKLTLNLKKTHYMIFNNNNTDFNVTIKNMRVLSVNQTKFLGTIISDDLKWHKHTKYICKKMMKFIHVFNNLKRFLSIKQLLLVFRMYVIPIYNYACEVYSNTTIKNIASIQTIQNTLLKLILSMPFRTSTLTIHRKTEILLLKNYFMYRKFMFMYDILQNPIKRTIYKNILDKLITNKAYSTRQTHHLFLSTNSYKTHAPYVEKFAIIYNNLSMNIKTNRNSTKCSILSFLSNSQH